MDETAAGANGVGELPAPNPNGGLLGVIIVEAGGKLRPPLPNSDEVDVVVVGVNVKLLGIVKAFVVEDVGNETVVVVTAGAGVIVEELNKFEEAAVLVVKNGADVLDVNVNAGD
jgi:hypothetical protein